MLAIATDFASQPDNTLVVSPDNASRIEINRLIHEALRTRGKIAQYEYVQTVLTPRQDLTGPDRQWASTYQAGDVIRYSRASRVVGVAAGEYVRVVRADRDRNLLTVRSEKGQELSYDPRRLQGVCVYREGMRNLSVGDRIQFTAPYKRKHVANRQIGTITQIDADGSLQARLDSGRTVAFRIKDHPHLDYGYAVTSHSAQGLTADRVLIHVDSATTHRELINSRLAYVAVSRARYDARIYPCDGTALGDVLSHSVTKRSALVTDQDRSQPMLAQQHKLDPEQEPAQTSVPGTTAARARSRSAELER
jgi:ATP-dependent exoDNAse (exonuclease V) alpha subunit